MKAVLQNFRTGELSVAEVPPPTLRGGGLLVHNVASLVSAGTEKAIIELAKMNPLQKARARPDLVRKVLSKAGQEGLLGTAQIVMNLVSTPLPLGYSCVGNVYAAGTGAAEFRPGDRVACAGLGYANHAEVVFVPRNLAVSIPAEVKFEEAAFVTVGAIAMHGVRQADVVVGETVVVLGLGLVGQLAAQICTAAGCRVFGIDMDASKVQLALELGAHGGQALKDGDVVAAVRQFTRQRGADAIIITAATPSNQPIELAAELARDRARVVAVGEVGMGVPRRAYYDKEIDLRLSRSYGPGRYDVSYEEKGQDYPIGYVRWTENRNMESFLDLVAERKVQITPLITHRFPIERAADAYGLLTGERREPYIGILLEYDAELAQPTTIQLKHPARSTGKESSADKQSVRFGIIGAGQFAQGVLLPQLRKIKGVEITGIATASGLTAKAVADKYSSRLCTSDYREILGQPEINAVLIATRHNLHAEMVTDALEAGKHVFVEKPLAINEEQLRMVATAYYGAQQHAQDQPILTVGFNRRFSPLAVELKKALRERPLVMNYRVNAGPIPADNWTQDPEVGGGRIVGEVCHFIDFLQYLTDSDPVEVFASALGDRNNLPADPDNLCIQLRFSDGSLGTITYIANGDPGFPKERVEVFGGGYVGVIDNWRALSVRGHGKNSSKRALLTAAKGHAEELAAFVEGIRTGQSPISFKSLALTTQATFAIQSSLREGRLVPIEIPAEIGGSE
ncbi:MAG: Gfo/Idh/MocA family oxidoreductase [Acidobacteria bacterium]|nr:Gfo/Idh/MocA family oxidoreductase [Acidobacteriota bacterium]